MCRSTEANLWVVPRVGVYLLISIMLSSPVLYAQKLPWASPKLLAGWQRIPIQNLGTIDLPPTLEVVSGEAAELSLNARKLAGLPPADLSAKPVGYSKMDSDAVGEFVNLLIETTRGNFMPLTAKGAQSCSPEDLQMLNMGMEKELKAQAVLGNELKTLFPARLEHIGGMPALHFSYIMMLNSGVEVRYALYIFMNRDRRHTLTTSYKVDAEGKWKSTFAHVVESFRITNIR